MKTSPVLRKMLLAVLALLMAVAAPACNLVPPNRPPQDALYTAGASTLIARLTLEAAGTPAHSGGPPPKQTLIPTLQPSDTPIPPSATPAPSEDLPTATPPPSPTEPAVPCNLAEFLGDVTVPLDSVFSGGTLLTKVWRVRNIGACTWGPAYTLIYNGGSLYAAPITPLPAVVPPGQIIDLSVALTVPAGPGTYQGSWMLRSDAGQDFGTGLDGSVPLYTRIQVPQPTAIAPTSFDFTQNYCSLAWRSNLGSLPCPGNAQDPDGSVVLVQAPSMETRRVSEPGLWTRPGRGSGGWISGQTPFLSIRSGDYFTAELGCLNGSPNCAVTFQFEYLASDGSAGRLGVWQESSDGMTSMANIDLSFLAGRTASFTLTVFNQGSQRDANAVWVGPRIQNGFTPRAATLNWTREGLPNASSCNELTIAHTGTNSALAIAYDCSGNRYELGRALLSTTQLDQLIAFERRLANFEGEMYTATGGHPVTSWISFRGQGQTTAGEPEIQALNSFAAQIYTQIVR